MNDAPIRLIAILGPTATGKTRLAAGVAAAVGGEVISADSRQVYREMDLGTGKDLEDYVVDGVTVPSHLIDIVDPGYEYNVFEYKCACVQAIREVAARGQLPILCGGTGLYLSAVLQDYQMLSAPPDPARHAELEATPTPDLLRHLKSFGSLHNTTDTQDRKRLIRAVEIAEADPSSRAPSIHLDARIFGIRWERGALRERIDRRLAERLDDGLIDEVRALLARGLTHDQLIFYGLEYRYVTEYIRGDWTRDQMFDELRKAIHQFAKRQDTWFRRMERQGVAIHWLEGHAPLKDTIAAVLRDVRAR